jgi:uncharacterized protein YbjQ (UPF0145 family)
MLGTITSIALVSMGAAVGIVIAAYAIYITFYPFARTVGGGLQVMKYYLSKQRTKALQRDYILVHDAQLGFTMADGGDRIKKKSRRNKK